MGKAILMSIKPQYVCEILNGKKTIEVRKRFPKDYVGWVYIYCTKEKLSANIWVSKTPEKCSKVILSLNEMQEDAELDNFMNVEFIEKYPQYAGETIYFHPTNLNGKVVARFWCDKISELECEFWEEPLFDENSCYQAVKLIERDLDYPDEEQLWNYHEIVSNEDGYTDEEVYKESKFLQKCYLSLSEIKKYVGIGGETRCFGIHISKLEVFDMPKELKEFRPYKYSFFCAWTNCNCLYHTKEECENCKETHIQKAPQSWQFIEGE